MGGVYAIGVFDLFHRGHLEFLRAARALGDRLVVAVNGDAMTASYKRRPVFDEEDRLALVRACRYVDEAFVVHGYDHREPIRRHGISRVVHGDDWDRASYLRQIRVDEDFLRRHDVDLVFVPYHRGTSTSALLERIRSGA